MELLSQLSYCQVQRKLVVSVQFSSMMLALWGCLGFQSPFENFMAVLLWECWLCCGWHPALCFPDVPNNLRAEAVQCVLLLLPDEHREALQTLLEFLCQVSARSAANQMTASNLAVCLAPSVFHLHHPPSSSSSSRSSSASPRRRKTVGVPDQRELGENRAAHDCLLYLIKEHKDLFMVCFVARFFMGYFICTQQNKSSYLHNAILQICGDASFSSHDYRMNLNSLGRKFIYYKEVSEWIKKIRGGNLLIMRKL